MKIDIILFYYLDRFSIDFQSLGSFIYWLVLCNIKSSFNCEKVSSLSRRNHPRQNESRRVFRINVHQVFLISIKTQMKIDLWILIKNLSSTLIWNPFKNIFLPSFANPTVFSRMKNRVFVRKSLRKSIIKVCLFNGLSTQQRFLLQKSFSVDFTTLHTY